MDARAWNPAPDRGRTFRIGFKGVTLTSVARQEPARLKTETLGKSVRRNVPRGRLEDVRDGLADLLRRHRAA
jgi:hypothetical protein